MKHLLEYKNIDFENWEEEEIPYSEKIPDGKSLEYYKQFINRKVIINKDDVYYKKAITSDKKLFDKGGYIKKIDMYSNEYPIIVIWGNSSQEYLTKPCEIFLVN